MVRALTGCQTSVPAHAWRLLPSAILTHGQDEAIAVPIKWSRALECNSMHNTLARKHRIDHIVSQHPTVDE